MSSHHIVRDNQEPALLLLDGDGSLYSLSQDFLEWSPAIIVDENLLDKVLNWGIKIDAVLFEENHRTLITEKIENQFPVKLINHKSEDEPVQVVINFLHQGNYSSLNILSERQDLFSVLENADSKMNLVLVQKHIRWLLIKSHHFEKWIGNGNQLTLRLNNEETILHPHNENKVLVQDPGVFWIGESL
jgi:thiamine pyrophosphokinase